MDIQKQKFKEQTYSSSSSELLFIVRIKVFVQSLYLCPCLSLWLWEKKQSQKIQAFMSKCTATKSKFNAFYPSSPCLPSTLNERLQTQVWWDVMASQEYVDLWKTFLSNSSSSSLTMENFKFILTQQASKLVTISRWWWWWSISARGNAIYIYLWRCAQ